MINCELSNPLTFEGEAPEKEKDIWQFSTMTCGQEGQELIQQGENSFFIDRSFSYGDFLIVAFLIIFFCGLVAVFIRDFTKNRKLERL